MGRGFLYAVVLLIPPGAVLAQGFDDSDGAVLAQPPDPRPQVSLASMFSAPAPTPRAPEPVIHPAPANPLPPAAHAPMPRVELPAYPPADRPIADRKSYALWSEKPAPLELPPERVGVLSADGRVNDAVASKPAAAPAGVSDQTFVNVEVELKEGGELRDAVAALSEGTGFRADMRFPAARSAAAPRDVSLWGWLPTGRLGAAAQLPSVRRLSSASSLRVEPGGAVSPMLIGLRVPEGFDPAVAVAAARADLATEAGVVWRRTIGYQAVPGSRDLAMIGLADVPVRSLSKVLSNPSVLRIAPAPAQGLEAPLPRDGKKAPSGSPAGRFLRYVASESPVLLVLTALLLLTPLKNAVSRLSRLL